MTKKKKVRGIYPILALLKHKCKHTKVEIPIRVKLITIKKYACPKCNCSDGTMKDLIKYINKDYDGNFKKSNWVYNNIYETTFPEEVLKKNDTIPKCPMCLKRRMVIEEKELYKVYVRIKKDWEFLNIEKILWKYTAGVRWKEDYNRKWDAKAIVGYLEDLKVLKTGLNWLNNTKKKDPHRKTGKMEVFRIYKKKLEKLNLIADQKKIEKAL